MRSSIYTVYVISCLTKDHYYVGMTGHYENRIDRHMAGTGAEWVKKHGFSGVIEIEQVRTIEEAKILELEIYYRYKRNGFEVRGAGNTPVINPKGAR